jgi:hypothetical protein
VILVRARVVEDVCTYSVSRKKFEHDRAEKERRGVGPANRADAEDAERHQRRARLHGTKKRAAPAAASTRSSRRPPAM